MNQMMTKIVNQAYKLGFKVKKHSPELLVISGVVGVVTSAVMACKATTKLSEILVKKDDELTFIHDAVKGNVPTKEPYTEEQSRRDITTVYVQTGLKIVKLYAPAVALGALSISAILYSNGILKKRNMALAAAYATVDNSFKDYRNRVIDRFGEEVDKELKYNIKPITIEETTVDTNGNEIKTEKTVNVADPGSHNMYTKIFDESSRYWSSTKDYNHMFLMGREQYANDLLNTRGYLFLNDVLDMLDIPRTPEGQVVGWVKDPDSVYKIDFGIFNANNKANRDFINGYEPSIWLDFNVDGYILDNMK